MWDGIERRRKRRGKRETGIYSRSEVAGGVYKMEAMV